MSALEEIIARRERLIAEAGAQRAELTRELEAGSAVLKVADRGIAWASWLRARPYLVVALATAVAVLRPKLALAWSARIVTVYRAGRFLYDAVKPALESRKSTGS